MENNTPGMCLCKAIIVCADRSMWKKVRLFILEFLEDLKINNNIIHKFLVICEEIYVNISQYAYIGKKGDVSITCGYETLQKRIFVKFVDSGIEFDPTKKVFSDSGKNLHERKLGGLGIFLVKNLSDSMKYVRSNNKNIFIVTKNIK